MAWSEAQPPEVPPGPPSGDAPAAAEPDVAAGWIGLLGAALGLLGVAVGALGRHALAGRMDPSMLDVFETATRYQLVHALAAVVTAILLDRRPYTSFRVAGAFFIVGIVTFCGSLYLMAITGLRNFGIAIPVGGVALMAGWLSLVIGFLRGR
jgi:uncharacterized membrane protein YgdD (TMEM256/DUF423 family)